MKTIIIVLLLICCICCILSSVSSIYSYNLIKDEEKIINDFNNNIINFNKKYNINYFNDNVLTQSQISSMYFAMVTIGDVNTATVTVNNIPIILYYTTVNYTVADFYGKDKPTKIIFNNTVDKITENPILPEITYPVSVDTIPVTSIIVTTKKINKGDNIKVYYDGNYRLAPPFVDSDYFQSINPKILQIV